MHEQCCHLQKVNPSLGAIAKLHGHTATAGPALGAVRSSQVSFFLFFSFFLSLPLRVPASTNLSPSLWCFIPKTAACLQPENSVSEKYFKSKQSPARVAGCVLGKHSDCVKWIPQREATSAAGFAAILPLELDELHQILTLREGKQMKNHKWWT